MKAHIQILTETVLSQRQWQTSNTHKNSSHIALFHQLVEKGLGSSGNAGHGKQLKGYEFYPGLQ